MPISQKRYIHTLHTHTYTLKLTKMFYTFAHFIIGYIAASTDINLLIYQNCYYSQTENSIQDELGANIMSKYIFSLRYSVIKKYHWVMYLNFIILARLILFLIGITEPRIKVHFCLLLSSNCARAVLLEILQSSISRKKIILFMQNHYPSPIGFCNLAAVVTFIIMT